MDICNWDKLLINFGKKLKKSVNYYRNQQSNYKLLLLQFMFTYKILVLKLAPNFEKLLQKLYINTKTNHAVFIRNVKLYTYQYQEKIRSLLNNFQKFLS